MCRVQLFTALVTLKVGMKGEVILNHQVVRVIETHMISICYDTLP